MTLGERNNTDKQKKMPQTLSEKMEEDGKNAVISFE